MEVGKPWTPTRVIQTITITVIGAIVMWAWLPVTYWLAATLILAGLVFGKDTLKTASIVAGKMLAGIVIFVILRFIGAAISGVSLAMSEKALRTKGWNTIWWASSAPATLAWEALFAVVASFIVWRAFSATRGTARGVSRLVIGVFILGALGVLTLMNARPSTAKAAYDALPTEAETTAAARRVGDVWRSIGRPRRAGCGAGIADPLEKRSEEIVLPGNCSETHIQLAPRPVWLSAYWYGPIKWAKYYCADGATGVLQDKPGALQPISCPDKVSGWSFSTEGLGEVRAKISY